MFLKLLFCWAWLFKRSPAKLERFKKWLFVIIIIIIAKRVKLSPFSFLLLMSLNESWWVSMSLKEPEWVSMSLNESQWVSVSLSEPQWVSMEWVVTAISHGYRKRVWLSIAYWSAFAYRSAIAYWGSAYGLKAISDWLRKKYMNEWHWLYESSEYFPK